MHEPIINVNDQAPGGLGTAPSLQQRGCRADVEPNPLAAAKVVVLTHYLPPYMERVLQVLSEQVPQMQVWLSVPLEPNRQYAVKWEGLQVRVQRSWMLRRSWRHRTGFADELYVHIPYDTLPELMRERPDLVFSYELGFRSLASALYRCWNRRSRLALCVCVSEHTERGRGGARWLLRRALLRSADAITFNGPSCRRYLESLGVPTHKLFPFSYAADDRVLPSGAPSDTPAPNRSLLVVGQLIERKGIVPVLNSLTAHCQQHPEQTWAVSFIGTGPLEATIRNWRSPANLQLALLGSLSPQELAQNWSRFGVLLFPTLADEWGLVVNEALRAGLPVIGSRYAQASSTLIEPGCNGWVYTPDLSGDLSRCLNDLWHQSAEQLTRMRQASRSSVRHITCRASADDAASMLRQLYLDTLKSTTTALSR